MIPAFAISLGSCTAANGEYPSPVRPRAQHATVAPRASSESVIVDRLHRAPHSVVQLAGCALQKSSATSGPGASSRPASAGATTAQGYASMYRPTTTASRAAQKAPRAAKPWAQSPSRIARAQKAAQPESCAHVAEAADRRHSDVQATPKAMAKMAACEVQPMSSTPPKTSTSSMARSQPNRANPDDTSSSRNCAGDGASRMNMSPRTIIYRRHLDRSPGRDQIYVKW
eukprot:TRINITY_DN40795_c0_g1_i1.p1 TRINITY_DN40795_c0_g1~~TRINITY_DN40795_c0_g1_i1.p1  ORF type:complete len:228 (+),score=26.84 TRINITY_DN40795_c0_g1_i1:47-730(+)